MLNLVRGEDDFRWLGQRGHYYGENKRGPEGQTCECDALVAISFCHWVAIAKSLSIASRVVALRYLLVAARLLVALETLVSNVALGLQTNSPV